MAIKEIAIINKVNVFFIIDNYSNKCIKKQSSKIINFNLI